MTCIFGSNDQWASVQAIAANNIKAIADYEQEFGLTIHRTLDVKERIKRGVAYPMNGYVDVALSERYSEPVFIDSWQLPAGAFGDSCGPT